MGRGAAQRSRRKTSDHARGTVMGAQGTLLPVSGDTPIRADEDDCLEKGQYQGGAACPVHLSLYPVVLLSSAWHTNVDWRIAMAD